MFLFVFECVGVSTQKLKNYLTEIDVTWSQNGVMLLLTDQMLVTSDLDF